MPIQAILITLIILTLAILVPGALAYLLHLWCKGNGAIESRPWEGDR